jgi:hypothetical protein
MNIIRRKSKPKEIHPENWSRFRRWREARPFTGSVLMMLAGLLILWGPISLMRFALLPGSMIWSAMLIGAALLLMGVLQLLVPTYALMAGSIGIILSLVSLVAAAGGLLGIGMILGLIGGSLSVAWKPIVRPLRSNAQS